MSEGAAFGQFSVIKDIDEIGFMAGPNFSKLKGADVFGVSKIKTGYHMGVNLNYYYPNTRRWSFSVNFLYERKGHKTENELFYYIDPSAQQLVLGKQTIETDIWAITAPILWKYRLNGGPVKFYIDVGGYCSLIKKMEFNFYSPDQGSFTDTRNNINEFDWGVSLGVRADYVINDKLILTTGILSNYGFASINDNSKTSITTTSIYVGTRIMKSRKS
ncbi:MAG: PorT family protein [Ignavibacterium sp.]|jgi:hypothetical protein|nr:PorT family protein [Ignavibacterium sp.]